MKSKIKCTVRLLRVMAVVAAVYGAVACASAPNDQETCTAQGFGPETGQFWTCMNYVQQERSIKAQRLGANAALLGVVKPRTCNAYGGMVQCW